MGKLRRDAPEPEPERVYTLEDGMDRFARVFERIVLRTTRLSLRDLLLFLAAFGTAAVAMGAIDGDPASFEFGAYLSSGSLALLSCNWRRFGRWRMTEPVPEPRARHKPGGVIQPQAPVSRAPRSRAEMLRRPVCGFCQSAAHHTEECAGARTYREMMARQTRQAREQVSRLTGVSPDAPGYYDTAADWHDRRESWRNSLRG